MQYIEEREQMCKLVKIMFDRFVTNAVGGNVSMRVGENLALITPALMAEEKFCSLSPEDIMLVDFDMNILEGNGKPSREMDMHCGILKKMPEAAACIHAHPKNILVFACLEVPLPSVTEATRKYGVVDVLPYQKACTPALAGKVIEYFNAKKEKIKHSGMAVMLARHGIVAIGRSLYEAYNVIERLESNAYIVLAGKLLDDNPVLKASNLQDRFKPAVFMETKG